MKHRFAKLAGALSALVALGVMVPCPRASAQSADIIVGKTVPFASKVLGREVNVLISLPEGYAAGTGRYPVLYVLNGAFTFNYEQAVVQLLSRLQIIPPMIVVGVPDFRDGYVPTPFERRGETPTPADEALRFLREELIPLVDKGHRTNPFRVLYGHSVGGLFTVHALFNAPDLFSGYIAGSPWFQVNEGYWLKNIEGMAKERALAGRILFMTVGQGEAELTTTTYAGLEKWFDGASLAGLRRKSVRVEGDHGSMVGRNTYDGLQFIFEGWRIPDALLRSADIGGIEAALAETKERWAAYGFDAVDLLPEARVNAIGYQLVAGGAREEAVRLLAYNVKRFPKSFNALDSLAEAYMTSGDRENAVKHYRLAVAANPGDTDYAKRVLENSKAKLKELGAEGE